jgi:hypothetical protein
MRILSLILFLFFHGILVHAQEINLSDTAKYPWYNHNMNLMQFHNRSAIQHFHDVWKAGKETPFVIVHTGDSHIQSDISTSVLRKNLQLLHGDGGKGMIFPYAAAKSYSSVQYKSEFTGEWEFGKTMIIPPKVTLGVTGMAIHTTQTGSSFSFTWNQAYPSHYRVLKIFCSRDSASFDLEIETAGKSYPVKVIQNDSDTLPYIKLIISELGADLIVRIKQNTPRQNYFEFYGISLESDKPGGMIYHAVGVGGSRFRGILYEDLFESHLQALGADLVILDFGTNDYMYEDSVKDELSGEIRDIVARIRKAVPSASILLTTTQDLYYKGRNIRSGDRFANLIRNLAGELDCMYWDWYWVSGGRAVLKKWAAEGLAQKDLIHLTAPGYKLKGRLLTEAFIRTIDTLKANPELDSLVLDITPLREAQAKRIQKQAKTDTSIPTGNYTVHRIRSGETLGHIAIKYGVTVRQIKQWNNLRSDMIIAGKTLIIYR